MSGRDPGAAVLGSASNRARRGRLSIGATARFRRVGAVFGTALLLATMMSAGASATAAAASGDGLLGTYYPNQTWSGEPYLTQVDPTIDFPNGPTPPPGRFSDFSVVWSGLISVQTAGTYTLGLGSDDGSVLTINGATAIDNGGSHGYVVRTNSVELAAGLNAVSLRYFQGGGGAVMRFLWTPPDGTDLVVVPQEVLFSNSDGSLTGPPARLAFAAQPSGGKAAQAFMIQPVVRVQDAHFQTVLSSGATVDISISPATGSAGAVLTCTGGLGKAAVGGSATFSGCAIDQPGWGYRLVANSPGLMSATSGSFDIIANGDGLFGTYYPNETWSGDPSAITVDPMIDFDWGGCCGNPYVNPPASSDPDGGWSIEWTGHLLAMSPGTYTFCLRSDDGSELFLDGSLVVYFLGSHPVGTVCGSVELTAGFHSVSLKYFECCHGEALVGLSWTRPDGVSEVVPQSVLFSGVTTATGTLDSGLAAGATSVTANLTSACPFVATGPLTGPLRFSTAGTTEIANIRAASAITAGQQTLETSAIPYAHPAGENVTQVVEDCAIATDTSPPVIAPTVTGTLGANGWYTSDVTVAWSVSDPESGIASSSGCGTTTLTTETPGLTYTCSATNGAGLSATDSVPVKRDGTAPTIGSVSQITAETGSTFVVAASDTLSCVRSATFTVGTDPHTFTGTLEVPSGASCSQTLALVGNAPFVPGTYRLSVHVEDGAGNPGDATGTLVVRPTERVVMLIQGISSSGLPPDVDCGNGLPVSLPPNTNPEVLARMRSIEAHFQSVGQGDGGIPFDDLTFYVVDYPNASTVNVQDGYCYVPADVAGGRPLMLPQYNPSDTQQGIEATTMEVKRLVSGFPAASPGQSGTKVDLVGHSQGGVIAVAWLAQKATTGDLGKLHSIVTLDSPLGGLSVGKVRLYCGFLHVDTLACLGWKSWQNLLISSPYIRDITNKSLTTERALISTLTCKELCVGTIAQVTLPGEWHRPIMACPNQVVWHGCFFTDRASLDLIATLVGAEVLDEPSGSFVGWATWPNKDLVTGSGLRANKRSASLDITSPAGPPGSIVTVLYRNAGSITICRNEQAKLTVDGSAQAYPITGVEVDDFQATLPNFRGLCKFEVPTNDDPTQPTPSHDLVITVDAPKFTVDGSNLIRFVVDAVEVGPPGL